MDNYNLERWANSKAKQLVASEMPGATQEEKDKAVKLFTRIYKEKGLSTEIDLKNYNYERQPKPKRKQLDSGSTNPKPVMAGGNTEFSTGLRMLGKSKRGEGFTCAPNTKWYGG